MNPPVGLFGAVMGITGLGLALRAAAPVFPGVVRAPAYVSEPVVALGVLVFIALLLAYGFKILRNPKAVRDEFTNAATLGFCGTLPVSMFLVAGGLAPYVPGPASVVWWSGVALMFSLMAWSLARWLAGAVDFAQVNAGWLIVWVGGIVAPGPGMALGHGEACRFLLGASATAALVLFPVLFCRAVSAPALPAALRPTWFILLVPPSLIYANGIALYPMMVPLESLFHAGLVLAVALLIASRGMPSWPFGPAWWAVTFPLDALAYAAARYAQDHPGAPWSAVSAAALALAAGAVALVLGRTLRSAASRRG